eukprot:scaffold3176_cov56-Phaeocystis_antarctica.AAC.5
MLLSACAVFFVALRPENHKRITARARARGPCVGPYSDRAQLGTHIQRTRGRLAASDRPCGTPPLAGRMPPQSAHGAARVAPAPAAPASASASTPRRLHLARRLRAHACACAPCARCDLCAPCGAGAPCPACAPCRACRACHACAACAPRAASARRERQLVASASGALGATSGSGTLPSSPYVLYQGAGSRDDLSSCRSGMTLATSLASSSFCSTWCSRLPCARSST